MMYSPSPWEVEENGRRIRSTVNGRGVAETVRVVIGGDEAETEKELGRCLADARLISAAPEMLGELKHTLRQVQAAKGQGRIAQPLALHLIERLEYVIAKAEGDK